MSENQWATLWLIPTVIAGAMLIHLIDSGPSPTQPGSPSVWVDEVHRDGYRAYWQRGLPPLGY